MKRYWSQGAKDMPDDSWGAAQGSVALVDEVWSHLVWPRRFVKMFGRERQHSKLQSSNISDASYSCVEIDPISTEVSLPIKPKEVSDASLTAIGSRAKHNVGARAKKIKLIMPQQFLTLFLAK